MGNQKFFQDLVGSSIMPVAKRGRPRKNKEQSPELDSDSFTFEKNEIILCHHHGELYKAKVLTRKMHQNTETGSEDPHYFVHYWGWNAQWDEWVEADRCLKHSPENIQKQKEMKALKNNANKTKKKKNKKKKKRQIEDSDESESDQNDNQNHNNSNSSKESQILQAMIEEKQDLKKRDLDDLDLNQRI